MTQLPVPLHQQDNDQFCGPATAQMILVPMVSSLVDQGVFEATMTKLKDPAERCKLITSPTQFADGLNATLGGPVRRFEAYYLQNQTDGTIATALIVQSLRKGIAAAVLIQGGGHWVAVTGATLPPDDPGGVQPEALFINNPWPAVPSSLPPPPPPPAPPPPPHDSADGCGSGGPRGQAEQVTISAWYQDPYLTPVTMCARAPRPLQQNLYIVIGAAGLTPTAIVPDGVQ